MRVVTILVALGGCSPDDVESGVQLGEESVTEPDPCTTSETSVGLSDPVLDGRSAQDLLDDLDLVSVAAPTWFDGTARDLDVALDWAGGDVVLVTIAGGAPECDVPPVVRLALEASLSTADGLVDEVITSTGGLIAGSGVSVRGELALDGLGGSLDALARLAGVTDVAALDRTWLDVHVSVGLAGDGTHGWMTAMGEQASSGTETGGAIVEADVAHW